MISVLTLAALAPLATDSIAKDATELSARVRPTSITIVNAKPEPRLLVFESSAGAPLSTLWLAPSGHYRKGFPVGTLDTMRFQVLLPDESGWRASDTIHLGELLDSGDSLIELLDLGAQTRFLSPSPRGPRFVEASAQLVPDTLSSGGGTQSMSSGSGHVPVVPPRSRQRGERPPPVGKRPLPPV